MRRQQQQRQRQRQPKRKPTLIDVLILVAFVGIVIGIGYPNVVRVQRRMALKSATGELRSIFHIARIRAISGGKGAGLKFEEIRGGWHYAMYSDGDRDGIQNDDIKTGIDTLIVPPRAVFSQSRNVTIGLIDGPVRGPDGDLVREPVMFNQSAICSFSSVGEATPGTIYVRDKHGDLWCLRVSGLTSKVQTLRYDRETKRWES
ncbi:MAG TPA: hypothetical protein VGQ36_23065 [Thermoanaerobaculia bacterium]|nr:hypothetical protein [Thermoanaerobaculia bacterium]